MIIGIQLLIDNRFSNVDYSLSKNPSLLYSLNRLHHSVCTTRSQQFNTS